LARHKDMETTLSKSGICEFYTTESVDKFTSSASVFLKDNVKAKHICLS